jgi:hypothetical protein
MATEDFYREFQRRRHKILGAYLALRAWERKVDCVALPRSALLFYLGLEKRMENERLARLKEDLRRLFPHSWNTVDAETNRYETLYLSRVKIPEEAKEGDTLDDLERAALIEQKGLRIGILDEIPQEPEIIKWMADVSHGISDFAQWQEEALMNDEPARYLRECKAFDQRNRSGW